MCRSPEPEPEPPHPGSSSRIVLRGSVTSRGESLSPTTAAAAGSTIDCRSPADGDGSSALRASSTQARASDSVSPPVTSKEDEDYYPTRNGRVYTTLAVHSPRDEADSGTESNRSIDGPGPNWDWAEFYRRLDAFKTSGENYDPVLAAHFPLFEGCAPEGHPYPEAWAVSSPRPE
eukprot:COSAG05_NODE_4889_length_1335_cov_1.630259_2_plen_175_part_00